MLPSRRVSLLSLGAVAAALAAAVVSGRGFDTGSVQCDPSYCRLPDCFCGGLDIPGGYSTSDVPQFVLLTFDDAVNSLNRAFFEDLFADRYNPNGCPIKVGDMGFLLLLLLLLPWLLLWFMTFSMVFPCCH